MKIGKILAQIREESKISQKQLAKKMGVSTSRVSRMETDITPLNDKEIESFIKAVDTPTSNKFQTYLKQDWTKLNKPDFFHPDRKSLWLAESALNKNDELKNGIDKNSVFYKQMLLHEQTMNQLAIYLEATEHTIACIGSIGVGKTSAICGFLGLIHEKKPVLHTGGGRSTVCEVQIQQGPEFGIIIDPLPEDEIYKFVYDFCDYLLAINSENNNDKKFFNSESFTLSKEIERCIRNMADLPIKRYKDEDVFKQEDQAAILVKNMRAAGNRPDEDISDDLKIKVIIRLNLENRKKTELWYSQDIEDEPLNWLRKKYFEINHGRHPDFSIPKKITINIPNPILSNKKLRLKIIDTKGVDDTAKREDLETHFNDPRTLTVFCSHFLDAPDETTKTLIERGIESGIKERLSNETAILVLPRNDEATSVNTLDGTPIEERDEGYQVRLDDIKSDLMKYGLRELPIRFYDERVDSPDEIEKFLINRVEALRHFYEKRVHEVAGTIEKVAENILDAKAEAAFSEVLKSLDAWIKNHKDVKPIGEIHEALIEAIEDKHTYAASVRACVNRFGIWNSLDYYYHIGFTTRSETVKSISDMVAELSTIIKNLQSREDIEPAHEFLKELLYFCNSETERLYQEIQRFGQETYKKKMIDSEDLWNWLRDQWGKGAGYKLRISDRTEKWFEDEGQKRLHKIIQLKVAEDWNNMLSKFEDLVKGIFE